MVTTRICMQPLKWLSVYFHGYCSTRVFPIASHFYPINPIIKILKRSTNQTKKLWHVLKIILSFIICPWQESIPTIIYHMKNIVTNNLPVISILLYLPITHYIYFLCVTDNMQCVFGQFCDVARVARIQILPNLATS